MKLTIDDVEEILEDVAKVTELELLLTKTQPRNKRKGIFITAKLSGEDELDVCIASIQFTKAGKFDYAFVFEPGRFRHCITEQLTEDQAIDESGRTVWSMEDVEKFFKRQPYEWEGKKAWLKKIKKNL